MADNIYTKIATFRQRISETKITKSGHNKFAEFKYYELQDFMPLVVALEKELGLTSFFTLHNVGLEGDKVEARLDVVNNENFEERVSFLSPASLETIKGQNALQGIGSAHTYTKRYCYVNYLNLTEGDAVDATIGKPTKDKVDTTPKPVKKVISVAKVKKTKPKKVEKETPAFEIPWVEGEAPKKEAKEPTKKDKAIAKLLVEMKTNTELKAMIKGKCKAEGVKHPKDLSSDALKELLKEMNK